MKVEVEVKIERGRKQGKLGFQYLLQIHFPEELSSFSPFLPALRLELQSAAAQSGNTDVTTQVTKRLL